MKKLTTIELESNDATSYSGQDCVAEARNILRLRNKETPGEKKYLRICYLKGGHSFDALEI
jgi:hypothetical protein